MGPPPAAGSPSSDSDPSFADVGACEACRDSARMRYRAGSGMQAGKGGDVTDALIRAEQVESRWFSHRHSRPLRVDRHRRFCVDLLAAAGADHFIGPPILHVHAILFTVWLLFFLSQTTLVAAGRVRDHRAWGLMGISLATAMVFIGLAAVVDNLRSGLDGNPDAVRGVALVATSQLLLFAGLFAAAVINISRPDFHKRLMVLANLALIQAAVARFFFLVALGAGPGLLLGTVVTGQVAL